MNIWIFEWRFCIYLVYCHLMAVETLFSKGALYDMPDASQSKPLCRWQRWKLDKVDL